MFNQKEYQKEYRQRNKNYFKNHAKQWRQKNKDKVKEYQNRWNQKNKEYYKQYQQENKDTLKICQKQWYLKNKDNLRLRHKQYRQKNREKLLQQHKKYYQENKEKRKQYRQRNKEKIAQYCKRYYQKNIVRCKMISKIFAMKKRIWLKKIGPLTIQRIQRVYENNIKKYGTLTCYLCYIPIQFGEDSIDHKTPLSRGGDNDYVNLGIAHFKCNCRKYNKTEKEYRKELENDRNRAFICRT